MIEPAIAIAGIVILWFLAVTTHALLEGAGLWISFLYALYGAAALYCLIRFIRWAWLTPMPFIDGLT